MLFGGMQKLTLLDYPEKTACTLFTIGCDFCCPFCQNSALINPDGELMDGESMQIKKPSPTGERTTQSVMHYISDTEVLDFLKTRKGLLDGVCISGGEPLLHDDLESFIDEVKSMDYLIKIDTNGSNPEKLKKLIASQKIDFVSMDIKNTPEKYAHTIGFSEYDIYNVEESINILLSRTIPFEFRTTVVREFHTEEDLLSIARWILSLSSAQPPTSTPTRGTQKPQTQPPPTTIQYFLQKFIDSDGVKQKGLHSYSDAEMKQVLSDFTKILPFADIRGV